jgi:Cu-Zn family superoxide dismutase
MNKTAFLAAVAVLSIGPAIAQTDAPAEGEGAATETTQAETAAAEIGATATATIKGADGADHGKATFTQTNSGVLIRAELTGLPPGPHGFHFHTTGACEPPFESAGGHFNPNNAKHGFLAEAGPHVGDIPNIEVPESGNTTVEHVNAFVSLSPDSGNTLLDEDGTAIVIHAGPDDYKTDPSGQSGDRIACGVVAAAP